jgi:hypothetical protein
LQSKTKAAGFIPGGFFHVARRRFANRAFITMCASAGKIDDQVQAFQEKT